MGRGRIIRVLKWAGVAWCLVLLVAWPLGATRAFGHNGDFGWFAFDRGSAVLLFKTPPGPPSGFFWLSGYRPNWLGYFAISFTPPVFFNVPT